MQNVPRPAPFVLVSSNHGTMIINRNDYHTNGPNAGYGVGFQIMNRSCFDQEEVMLALGLLRLRRHYFGAGVVAVDCGANIGVHTIEWARLMYDWGSVYAFEAQEKIFYALAGNVVINNCLNVTARHAAVGASVGEIDIPEPNYLVPSSFGSFELKSSPSTEFIGQSIDYSNSCKRIPQITLDSLSLPRLDFIKIDVEGMEEEVMAGAARSIEEYKPVMIIEVIKSNKDRLFSFLADRGYSIINIGINILAVHGSDSCQKHLKVDNGRLYLEQV